MASPYNELTRLAEEVLAEEVELWAGGDLDIAIHNRATSKTHRLFVANERHARNWIWNWKGLELYPLAKRHRIGVVHSLGDKDAASTAGPHAHAVYELVDRCAKTIEALIEVDSSLDCLIPKIGSFGDLNFLLFLDEFDDGHGSIKRNRIRMKNQPLRNPAIETNIIASFPSSDHEGTQVPLSPVFAKSALLEPTRNKLGQITGNLPAKQGGFGNHCEARNSISEEAFEADC